jgi:hypothetical protein
MKLRWLGADSRDTDNDQTLMNYLPKGAHEAVDG